ncbi:hypothetical protein HPP92_024282 [Vanilla planifolia]|uniref:Uncharacterized protein n=1 Tax=Vanilla planifolia TaxID=51239 RepID=A0A835PRQ5_VANPL|nr:hypothetical protein HPP92_024282 [Vanilla planifolia]
MYISSVLRPSPRMTRRFACGAPPRLTMSDVGSSCRPKPHHAYVYQKFGPPNSSDRRLIHSDNRSFSVSHTWLLRTLERSSPKLLSQKL